jgi:hypothetical protein
MQIVRVNDTSSPSQNPSQHDVATNRVRALIQVPKSTGTFPPPQTHHQTHHLTMPASEPEAAPRFKRRKTTSTKRVRADDSSALAPSEHTSDAPAATSDAPQPAQHEEGDVPNLKEILRGRKRVRDYRGRELGPRMGMGDREVVKADVDGDALGLPGSGREGRFVRQTGQVVDVGDREM